MRLVWVVIPLVLIGIVGMQNADAIWGERHPRELLKESETVFVGIIQSVNVIEHEQSIKREFSENGTLKTVFENYTVELDEYTIEVEEYLKNPQESNTTTLVQATVSTWGATPMKGFEIGDRVLFYVPSIQHDGIKQYSLESFKIPRLDCKPRPLVEVPCISVNELKQMLSEGIPSPLKQIQSGTSAKHIVCKDGLELIFKSSNNFPACVTSNAAEKLFDRAWAFDKSVGLPFGIVNYTLKGDAMFTLVNTQAVNSLVFGIDAETKGMLTVQIPRTLIDAKIGSCDRTNPDDVFSVLINANEISYDELITTTEKRTLQFLFDEDTETVEIIGTCENTR